MSEIFFLFIKMKSLVIIIAILSVNGVRAGENNGPNIAEYIKYLMEATRPVCAEKLKQDEDDLKDFEESYKSNELQESDIYQYGAYLGCLLHEWKILRDDGQLDHDKFNDMAKKVKNNKEGSQKLDSMKEKLTNILEGTSNLEDSGSRLIAAKIKAKNNFDESMNDAI